MITMLADMQVGGMQVAFHIETKDPISEKSGTRARPLEEGRHALENIDWLRIWNDDDIRFIVAARRCYRA